MEHDALVLFIEGLHKHVEIITKKVKEYCQNKNNPLDKRWNLFISSDLGNVDTMYHHPDGIDWTKVSLQSDFYCNRYDTLSAEEMIEEIENGSVEGDVGAVKEYFLSNFIKEFKNNW